MTEPLDLEFVLVSSDYSTMQAVSKAVKRFGSKFVLVPSAHEARECLNRRKIDGLFVDMEVPGALGLIESTRQGASNNKAVVFACLVNAKESTQILAAGANFLLRKPVTEDGVAMHITISKELLSRERRRYFRHAVNLAVTLKEGATEQQGRITNLSAEGMAVRTVRPPKQGAVLDFTFELSMGASISARGLVAWVNSERMAGIILQTVRGKGSELLENWLTSREQLRSGEKTPEA